MPSIASRVLITGGLGYVGGRLATYLISAAPEISLRLMTRRNGIQVPEWARSLDLVRADLRDASSLPPALEGIDTVIHLAAINEIESQQDPETALDVNGAGTYRLLQACVAQGVRRFIYFSTFHVYGPSAPQPITELTPTKPIHPYAITHRLAEDYVNWHRHSYGLETLILRVSNGYGYPADPLVQRWSLVFNDLCWQAVRHGRMALRSGGAQHRDFVALSDVARAVHHLLEEPEGGWKDGLFNLGGECSLSILEVANRIASEFRLCYEKEIPVVTGGTDDSQVGGLVAFSIEKLKQTGFMVSGNMSEEIRGTFRLCRQLAGITK